MDGQSRRTFLKKAAGACCALAAASNRTEGGEALTTSPNIVLILVDDMGYSDIGCYGGEIGTPNIDALAEKGVRFTHCYNTGRCCPTRASILTGLHPHQTGIGHMTNTPENPEQFDKGIPGYRGFLNKRCVTLAEVLKEAGYKTLMSGKWHVGMHKRDRRPRQRGFDRFYGILSGGTNYFHPTAPRGLTLDNEDVDPEGEDFYLTDAFTDYAIRFMEKTHGESPDQPFFLYLAYTAPHWPLHAPAEDVERYRGKYLEGWETIRSRRYERMVQKGVISEDWELSARDCRPWEDLSEEKKREMDLRMAIYAAQVHRMDWNVGRIVEWLEKSGQLNNTLLLFLSDNGGCAEGGELGGGDPNDLESDRGWVLSYGRAWANVSNTPFRRYKHWVHEGGMATPLIAHWPEGVKNSDGWRHDPVYLPDFMATLIDVAGASYPTTYAGNDILPLEGESFLPVIRGKPLDPRVLYWEHEGNRAVRKDNWKLVAAGRKGQWELYDMSRDRSELQDLKEEHPGVAQELADLWEAWAERTHVKPYP